MRASADAARPSAGRPGRSAGRQRLRLCDAAPHARPSR